MKTKILISLLISFQCAYAQQMDNIINTESDKKITSAIQAIYSQAPVVEETITDSFQNDTIVYIGIFNQAGDSVSIETSTSEKIDVFIRPVSQSRYVVCFYCNHQLMDSLNVICINGKVLVNRDLYILHPESYNEFKEMRSVLTLSHLLFDCLGDYPRDILTLLNLNWGRDYYRCHPLRAVTIVQSPHSDMEFKFEADYTYDKHNNFVEIIQGDRYTRKVSKRDEDQTQYSITYNYADRLSGQYIRICNKFGDETVTGSYTQVPIQQEFIYEQEYRVSEINRLQTNNQSIIMLNDVFYKKQ